MRAMHSILPHCSAKAKGERQAMLADVLAESNEISQLTLKRPMDRVRESSEILSILIILISHHARNCDPDVASHRDTW